MLATTKPRRHHRASITRTTDGYQATVTRCTRCHCAPGCSTLTCEVILRATLPTEREAAAAIDRAVWA
jgi:hypothetical protein